MSALSRRRWWAIAGSLVLLTLPTGLAAQDVDSMPRVLPVDEAAQDPGFFAFRASLQRAIIERDTTALLAVVDSTIQLSFGGDVGIDRFLEFWLESSDGDIWVELGAVLALGGRFLSDSLFYAPYTFNTFAHGEQPSWYDPYEALIAIDDAVPVLAAPEPSADTLAVLSFHLVRHEWRSSVAEPPAGWTAIRLADDTLGFVRTRSVRSPLDYRAVFERREGCWRMTIFIAGD